MKRYEYEDKFFSIEVTITGIICIVTALVSLFFIFAQTMTFVFEIVLIVSIPREVFQANYWRERKFRRLRKG